MNFDTNDYINLVGNALNNTHNQTNSNNGSLIENMNKELSSLNQNKRKYEQYVSDSSSSSSSDEDDDYGFNNVKKKVVKDPRTRTLRHTVTPLLATKGLIISNMDYQPNPRQKWDIKVMLSVMAGSGAIVRIEDTRNNHNIQGDFLVMYYNHIECDKGFNLLKMCKNLPFSFKKTILLDSKFPKIPNILFVNFREGFPRNYNIELCPAMVEDVPFNFNPNTIKQRKLEYQRKYNQEFPDDPKHYSNGRNPHMYVYGISKQQVLADQMRLSDGAYEDKNLNKNTNSIRLLEEKQRLEKEQLKFEEQERNSFFASNDIQQISRYNLLNNSRNNGNFRQQVRTFPDILLKASETLPVMNENNFKMSAKKLKEATSQNKAFVNIEKTLSAYEPRQIIQTISTLKNLISPITSNIEHRKIVEKQISDFLQSKQQILFCISQVFYEFGMIDLKNITRMIKTGQVSGDGNTTTPLSNDQQEMLKNVMNMTPEQISKLPQTQQAIITQMRSQQNQ